MTEELNLNELFSNFVKFSSRNKKFILIFMAIGVLSVILFQKFKTPYYETKAICMSGISEYERQEQIEDLSQRTAIDLINHLQINIENKEFNQLSKVLGIDSKTARTIKKIEAEQLYQQDMDEKFYALNKFEILLILYDNTKLSDVENGLIYYFENNDFVRNYHEKYLESNVNLISNIENEIQLLGNIRIEGAKNNLDVSSVNIISGKEGKELSNQIVSLSHLREEIKMNQALLKPLVYVQKFANVEQKEDDILVWSLLAGLICYFIGLLVALIKEVK
ncbi:MAG: hypothetical protein ABR80_04710 [Cryomorphaceae bacterium BACL11 MAG-121015-bin20]|nr:MAG: hypothetical protein ABR80_04710 [Cryomorphaceae bacterium BACL11 MAG-121015-bin20]